ncbi:MAG: homoserine kinase [Spirochaetes bacterium]|nr:homoserine kinase [Spirochaetota bacterium]MBU1079050.1 homoserine kinase [Spirochaetota bacterium]
MIRVFAPATSANLNVGFDSLGVALSPLTTAAPPQALFQALSPSIALETAGLGDEVRIEAAEADSFPVTGPYAAEIRGPNIVTRALLRVRELSGRAGNASIELHKGMPVGSGLGSSAASVVAAVMACDEFYGNPLGPDGRIALMGELEAELSGGLHWDNILPCALGGLRLGSSRLPVPAGWVWLVAYPGIRLETKAMRSVLPASVSLREAVERAGGLGLFVDALHRGDGLAAAALMTDHIVEPRRSPMIPGFGSLKEALRGAGALASGISGSGPTVFAVFDDADAAEAGLAAAGAWAAGVAEAANGSAAGAFARLCRVDEAGARVVEPASKER